MSNRLLILIIEDNNFNSYIFSLSRNEYIIKDSLAGRYNSLLNLEEYLLNFLKKNKIRSINALLFIPQETFKFQLKTFPIINEAELSATVDFEKEKLSSKNSSSFIQDKKLVSDKFSIKNNVQYKFIIIDRNYIKNIVKSCKTANINIKFVSTLFDFVSFQINETKFKEIKSSYIFIVELSNKIYLNLAIENEFIFSKEINNISTIDDEIELLIKYSHNNYAADIYEKIFILSLSDNNIINQISENKNKKFEIIENRSLWKSIVAFYNEKNCISIKNIFEIQKEKKSDLKKNFKKILLLEFLILLAIFIYTPVMNYNIKKKKLLLAEKVNQIETDYNNFIKNNSNLIYTISEKEKILNIINSSEKILKFFSNLNKIFIDDIILDEMNFTETNIMLKGKARNISSLTNYYSQLQQDKLFNNLLINKSEKNVQDEMIYFTVSGNIKNER